MRKSTLFISAVLTVFLMVTIFGVASAYQQVIKNGEFVPFKARTQVASQVIQPNFSTVQVVNEPTAPMVITPEEATTIAVEFLGDSNAYSVEVVDYEGTSAYLVTFSSGDLVYVNSAGVVIANTKIQPVVVVASSGGGGGGGSGQDNGSDDSGGGGHESEDDHEGDHESHDGHEDGDD